HGVKHDTESSVWLSKDASLIHLQKMERWMLKNPAYVLAALCLAWMSARTKIQGVLVFVLLMIVAPAYS
nr:M [Kampung Karu virus] [Kampung Karu virus]